MLQASDSFQNLASS